jgi:cytochrome c-type protein NapC
MADMPTGGFWSRLRQTLFTPSARYSVFALLAAGVVLGAAGLVTFDFALHATSTNEFCSTCHANDAAKEWRESKHYSNPVGFVAGCSDCHLPREFVPKMVRKVKAAREVWNHFTGKINTPEKFEAHRKEMAENEWARMKGNGAQECRNCHSPALSTDKDKAEMHKGALAGGAICIDCHKGVAHKAPG